METTELAEAPAVSAGDGSETAAERSAECLIHLKFYPDGTVAEIGQRPAQVKPQAWFNYLSQHTQNRYQALSGGRGLFRLTRAEVEALQAACVAEQAS
ncbi:hypothetical protein [Candidatus Methylocalor cossyra]|uniref:Uncharacterized protein n=1 Tax=Candidatus Methylocalor cossyra TaxID=3108543 RepID=A0ABM9NGN8_9GAMM